MVGRATPEHQSQNIALLRVWVFLSAMITDHQRLTAERFSSLARIVACCLAGDVPLSAGAETIAVMTADALTAALAQAMPGDEIVLRDGSYRGKFTLAHSGLPTKPITVRAEHPREAIFADTLLTVSGNHGVLREFVFERSQVTISGDHNRVAHNIFRKSDLRPVGMNAAVRIIGSGSHNRIHHNEVTEWSTYGFRVIQPNERMTGNQ